MAMDTFWQAIEAELEALRTAPNADAVITILGGDLAKGEAFFAGSGGDGSIAGSLRAAGWRTTWAEADYYWVMRAPDGSLITYVEGDVFRGDQAIRNADEETGR